MSIENIINEAWEKRDQVNQDSDQNLKDTVNQIIDDLDSGKVRVAEKINVNGATHADLDNDGDLDLICNAINDVSFILENKTNSSDYLTIELDNVPSSAVLYGTKVLVYAGDQILLREIQPTRGFQSAVSSKVHFGLGNASKIDSLEIEWSSGKKQLLYDITSNQKITVNESNSNFNVIKKEKSKRSKPDQNLFFHPQRLPQPTRLLRHPDDSD